MSTQRTIEEAIKRLLKEFNSLPDEDEAGRKALFEKIAKRTFEIREHFLTPEGKPDWTGRSGKYRLAMRDLYSDAGIDPLDAITIQKNVRYYVGKLQRATLTTEELEDSGLDAEDHREKMVGRRQADAALLAAVKAANEDSSGGTVQEKAAALSDILVALQKHRPNKRQLREAANLAVADAAHQVLRSIIARAEQLLEVYPARD